jgi:hypothetical protein
MAGATDEMRELLRRSVTGVDQVESWWLNFKQLRRSVESSRTAIERFFLPILESQELDAQALLQLRELLQAFHDTVTAHAAVPEQQYVLASINTFLLLLSDDVDRMSTNFDAFNLALYAMTQFPNARDRFEWIERYRRLVVGNRLRETDLHDYFTAGTGLLRNIRASLRAQPIGYLLLILLFCSQNPLFSIIFGFTLSLNCNQMNQGETGSSTSTL